MIITSDDDDDEPLFRTHYVKDKTAENGDGYWEDYNRIDRTWFRLCDQCPEKVCSSSTCLCTFHCNNLKKSKKKSVTKKTKFKRLNRKKDKVSIEEEVNEPSEIIISVSSSLSKKQISQVKDFITKFHSDSQTIQFTCETQPDYIDDTTTHVITNDFGLFTTSLTKQIIQACIRHIFISSINWITSSLDQSSILGYFSYEILRDKNSPIDTRGIKQCRFDQLPVFPSSCIISVECHSGLKSFRLTREELIEIIDLSGASLLNDYIDYQTLIVLCQTKKEMLEKKKSLKENETTKTIYYSKPEFFFDSIVRHEVQNIDKYLW